MEVWGVRNLSKPSWGLWSDPLSSGEGGVCIWMCQGSKAVNKHLSFRCVTWVAETILDFESKSDVSVICFPRVQTVLKPEVVKIVHKLSDAFECFHLLMLKPTNDWNFASFPMETLNDWQLHLLGCCYSMLGFTLLSNVIVVEPDLWSVQCICPSLKFCTVLVNLGVDWGWFWWC